jgi:hypothetical protein
VNRWWIVVAAIFLLPLIAHLALSMLVGAESVEKRVTNALASRSDGVYRVEIEDVDFSLLGRSFRATGVTIAPDTLATADEPGDAPRYTAEAASIRLTGIRFLRLLVNRELRFHTVDLLRPNLHVALDHTPPDSTEDDTTSADSGAAPSFHHQLARHLPYVAVEHLRIDSASIAVEIQTGDKKQVEVVDDFSFRFERIEIDSTNTDFRPLFSDNVRFRIGTYQRASADSLYLLYAGAVEGSTRDSALTVDSLSWTTTVSDEAFMRRQPHRTNRYKVGFRTLALQAIDYWSLLEERRLAVASADMERLFVDVYNDETLPEKPVRPATLPHDAFQSIGRPVDIDTIRVTEGHVEYSKRADDGVRPGTIRFEDIWATIYNVTNDPARMTDETPAVVDARTLVAGAGLLQTRIDYQLLAPELTIQYRGEVGDMPATAFNEIFVDLSGVEIKSGQIDSIWFSIQVQRDEARGLLQVLYRDLKIELLDKATGERSLRNRIATFIANNMILNEENQPTVDTPAKVIVIRQQRPPEKRLFKFMWHTLREGLFTTIDMPVP